MTDKEKLIEPNTLYLF